MFIKLIITFFALNQLVDSIKVVSDDALISLIQENKDLIILFSKKGCENCKYEKNLIRLEEDFESLFPGSRVIKAEDSQMLRLYNPFKKDPTLVFLRNGVPLLYPPSDPDNAEEIYQFFNDNRDPLVKELDDSNFEHLTQASTGSTTGNWLVLFYDNSCVDCTRLGAICESVAAKLKLSYTNVARTNTGTKGIQTSKRFKVEKVPTFILIRKGKYYRYNLKNYEVESLIGFATKTFQNFGAEAIKAQASPFENLIDTIVEKLKQMPNIRDNAISYINDYPLLVLSIAIVFVLYILVKLFKGKPAAAATSEPKKKKEEKKEQPADSKPAAKKSTSKKEK